MRGEGTAYLASGENRDLPDEGPHPTNDSPIYLVKNDILGQPTVTNDIFGQRVVLQQGLVFLIN